MGYPPVKPISPADRCIREAPPHRPSSSNKTGEMNIKNPPDLPAEYMTEDEMEELYDDVLSRETKGYRIMPTDFPQDPWQMAIVKARMVNLYHEYGGNWIKVVEDVRSCSRSTLARYWRDDRFRACCRAIEPLISLEAQGVVIDVFQNAKKDSDRLAAATRWLEAHKGEVWDRGVRKQIVANKGSIANTVFSKVISNKEFWEGAAQDPFAPPEVRRALAQALGKEEFIPIEDSGLVPPPELGDSNANVEQPNPDDSITGRREDPRPSSSQPGDLGHSKGNYQESYGEYRQRIRTEGSKGPGGKQG